MTPLEEADAQLAQFMKDYPTLEYLTNSIKKGEWEEIKGNYGGVNGENKWNPALEGFGHLYITMRYDLEDGGSIENYLCQYFDFSHYQRNTNHRYVKLNEAYEGSSSSLGVYNYEHDIKWQAYERLLSGEWTDNTKFVLYTPYKKWYVINWKTNPMGIKE
jgi:hypothetical protein